MPLTYKDVADIIKIIDASKLDEIAIEIDGVKMHVRRGASGTTTAMLPTSTASARASATSSAVVASEATVAEPKRAATPHPAGHTVRSPMIGVFYRAPSPKDPPFVEVGTIVKRGDPLCLVEVMKLFTTISADRDGRVTHILPGNGDLVEFDQPLFVIGLT